MKTLMNIKALSVMSLMLFLLTAGCSYMQANLVKNGALQLEIIPTYVKIASVRVYQEGELINVSGELLRQNCDVDAIDGHVDIAFFSPDKKLLHKASINYGGKKTLLRFHVTHHHRKHFNRNFEVAIPLILPQGAKIKIAFHNVPFDGSRQTDCGKNMATM